MNDMQVDGLTVSLGLSLTPLCLSVGKFGFDTDQLDRLSSLLLAFHTFYN